MDFLAAAARRAADGALLDALRALCCSKCGTIAVTEHELLTELVPFQHGSAWSYELDVFERPAHVYSTVSRRASDADMHGDAERFDIARVNAATCYTRLRCDGEIRSEHAWFPACARTQELRCRRCPQHLGWLFLDEQGEASFGGGATAESNASRLRCPPLHLTSHAPHLASHI